MSNEAPVQHLSENPRVPLGVRNGSATFVISIVGLMIANLVPLIMAVFTDQLGLSLVRAGEVVTWSLLASAVSGLGTARFAAGGRRRAIAATGLALSVVSFVGASIFTDPSVVIACFIVGGFGVGAAISTSGAAMAAIRNPNRVTATSGFTNRIVVMVILAVLPMLGLAQVTVFGTLALLAAIGLALAVWLPNVPEEAAPVDVTTSVAIASPRRITLAGIALLIVFPLWGLTEDSFYAMTGVFAAEVGMGSEQFGLMLSGAAAIGAVIMGVLLVAGNRIGRALPMGIALVTGALAKALLAYVTDPTALFVLVIVVNGLYALGFVMFAAAAAGLDARGRWSAPLAGAYIVGSSFAPLFGAWLVETFGVSGFGYITAVIGIILVAPAVLTARVSTGAERALVRAAERAAEDSQRLAERRGELTTEAR